MMNENNSNMELGLSLGCPSQSIRTRLTENSGAGVNAGSRVDTAYLESNPLSELVWSPHKGLRLKCASCSLTEKKPSCLWDVGPSNMVISPSDSIISRETDDDAPIHVNNEGAEGTSLVKTPKCTGCKVKEVNAEEESIVHLNRKEEVENERKSTSGTKGVQFEDLPKTSETNAGQESQRAIDFLPPVINESKSESIAGKINGGETDISGRIEGVSTAGQMQCLETALASEVDTIKRFEALEDPALNLSLQVRATENLPIIIEEGKNKMERHGSTNVLLEKLESTAENDVQHLMCEVACCRSEERLQKNMSVPVEAFATAVENRMHLYQRKGKPALSDEALDERMSKDENDSHESMESCSSVGLFVEGKKRRSFEQLIVGSKRIKKQVQENPTSTSLVKQDSSFMNWISNMVKGLTNSNQDGHPLAVTVNHPDHGLQSSAQKNNTCNKTRDSGSGNMGFQSIFQSLYFTNTKVNEMNLPNESFPLTFSKELVTAEKTCADIVMPISCCMENDNSCKQYHVTSKCFKHCMDGNEGSSSTLFSTQNQIACAIAATEEIHETNFMEKNSLRDLARINEKAGISSSGSSLDKQQIESAEKNSSESPSEGKVLLNIGNRSDPLTSLWITRFSSRTPYPGLISDYHDRSTHVILEHSTECPRSVLQNHSNHPFVQKKSEAKGSSSDLVNAEVKELQNHASSAEASITFKRVWEHNPGKPMSSLNSPCQKLKISEAMASVFAKRLDVLKRIILPDVNNDSTPTRTTCSFCGKSAHDLCNCSEVKKNELEDIIRSTKSHNGAQESSRLCLRCFQHDHWAATCPVASSSMQQQSENDATISNYCNASKVKLLPAIKESYPRVAGEDVLCNVGKPQMSTDLSLSLMSKGKIVSDKRVSCLNEVQNHISQSCGEVELKENQIPFNFASKQISGAPNMFDFVRRLRLSRTDIIKWTNSHMSLSCLDGFFLRLRLGKWEKGLGGTGYYVACINEMQRETSPKSSKNSIFVSVGGIKCFVESQYVSNHDFLEDELMAWWYTTLNSGKIPTEGDLESKFEERKKLGF